MSLNNQVDDAQFESGYSAEPTETPEPVAKQEDKPEPAAVAEPQAVDQFKEVIARLEKFEKGHATLAGHVGGLQRSQKEIQNTLAAASAASKTVVDAPTQSQVMEAMSDPEEWAGLKSEYPQWALATEKIIDAKVSQIKPQSPIDQAAIDKMVSDRVAGETAAVRTELINSHLDSIVDGDWLKEVNTAQFSQWIDSQSADVKALAESSKTTDAAKMLRLYESHKKAALEQKVEPKKDVSTRQKRIEAAINPKGTGGHAANVSELDDFESGYKGR